MELFAQAFLVVFWAAILALKVWSPFADDRRVRRELEAARRRPNCTKIARLERELGIPIDRAEAWRAERTVDDGLDRLFRRLGPPTDHDNEK